MRSVRIVLSLRRSEACEAVSLLRHWSIPKAKLVVRVSAMFLLKLGLIGQAVCRQDCSHEFCRRQKAITWQESTSEQPGHCSRYAKSPSINSSGILPGNAR